MKAHHSQASLKADITQKCKALNQKKATLDIKADVSANMNRLDLLKKELAELEEKVAPPRNSSRPRKLPLQTPNKKPRKYLSRYKKSLQKSAP